MKGKAACRELILIICLMQISLPWEKQWPKINLMILIPVIIIAMKEREILVYITVARRNGDIASTFAPPSSFKSVIHLRADSGCLPTMLRCWE